MMASQIGFTLLTLRIIGMFAMDFFRLRIGLSLLIVSLFSACSVAQDDEGLFTLEISASETARTNEVVTVMVPSDFEGDYVSLAGPGTQTILGQLSSPGMFAGEANESGEKHRELTFVLPALEAGKTLTLTAKQSREPGFSFQWQDNGKSQAELLFDDRNVMTYMYTPLDESTDEKRAETYKVYHQVYSPSGDKLVTKGPGGKFPHHRGLFYGFNRLSYDGKKADVWHCKNGAYQSHENSLEHVAGPVFARDRVEIAWRGMDGEPFATETRQMTAYKIGDATMIEFNSHLESLVGEIVMKGDPQHAGFQFRAAQSVAEDTAGNTFYIRPDGKGEPGKYRNWNANKSKMTELDAKHVNLPWNAMNFWVGEDNYTCCYLDLDSNPKQSRFSERDYGRFGSYFEYVLTKETPLDLRYRIYLQDGEMTVEEIEALSQSFRNPVEVTVR